MPTGAGGESGTVFWSLIGNRPRPCCRKADEAGAKLIQRMKRCAGAEIVRSSEGEASSFNCRIQVDWFGPAASSNLRAFSVARRNPKGRNRKIRRVRARSAAWCRSRERNAEVISRWA